MPRSITNTSSLNNKNVRNNSTVVTGDIKSGNIICTNLTATNIINNELQTATSNIATNASNISTNTTAIATNATNIATNTTAIATNATNIATNTTAIATNATNIATNTTAIATNTTNIATNTTAIATNATNIATNTSNISTNTTNIANKQDVITSTTSISCADINLNTNSLSGATTITCRSIELHNSANNLSFLDFGGGDYRFRQIYNQNNNNFQMIIDDATGENPEKKLQIDRTEIKIFDCDFNLNSRNLTNGGNGAFSSITLSGSDLQGKLDAKQDNIAFLMPLENVSGIIRLNYNSTEFTVNASDELELTGTISSNLNLNNNNLNNGGSGAFSSITLNSNDLQGLLDAKEGIFAISSNGLIMDSGAFPVRELRLLYDPTYLNINGSNELSLNGVLPTLTSNLNLGNNNITNGGTINGTDINCNNITNNLNISTSTFQATRINPPSDYPTNAILRHCSFNTSNTNSTSSGNYGSNSYLNGFVNSTGDYNLIIGNNAITKTNNGIFTINSAGTYKITCTINGDNVSVNDRVVLGFYLSLNTNNTNWQTFADSFGMMYLRDDNFGQGGTCSFSSVRTYAESDNIRIKTKCGIGNNNWDETRNDGDIDIWANITFEKLF